MQLSRKFKAFLSFNWHWYLIILLSTILAFYYVFLALRTPGYDEQIQVFIAAKNVEKQSLEESLYIGFEETKIKGIFIDNSDPYGSEFSIIFNTRGTVNTDIIIMDDKYINSGDYDIFFTGFTLDEITNYISGDEELLYDTNGLIYGICVNRYLPEIESDESMYLFFNKNSKKIGLLSEKSENNYALLLLENIVGRGKNEEK